MGRLRGFAESFEAGDARRNFLRSGDDGDAAMAEADEEARRFGGRGAIIQSDRRAMESDGQAIEKDEGHLAALQTLPTGEGIGAGKQNAIDAMGEQRVQLAVLNFRVAIGVAKHNGHAAAAGLLLGAPHQFGEKGIGDVGNHHADHVGGPDLEAAGYLIGMVVECARGLLDAAAQFRADGFFPRDDRRNGGNGHAGKAGDVSHGVRHGLGGKTSPQLRRGDGVAAHGSELGEQALQIERSETFSIVANP